MTMASTQKFYDEMTEIYNIPKINLINKYNSKSLEQNLKHFSKPSISIYESVINELGTNDFYFFDDSKENIESAQSLDIKAYQVTGDTIKESFKKILVKK